MGKKAVIRTFPHQQKVSRAMMTRGGSQEDPAQLLRDLQDSLEREADLREQLKNAEEEVSSLLFTTHSIPRYCFITKYCIQCKIC